jgi:hypothetical protein
MLFAPMYFEFHQIAIQAVCSYHVPSLNLCHHALYHCTSWNCGWLGLILSFNRYGFGDPSRHPVHMSTALWCQAHSSG